MAALMTALPVSPRQTRNARRWVLLLVILFLTTFVVGTFLLSGYIRELWYARGLSARNSVVRSHALYRLAQRRTSHAAQLILLSAVDAAQALDPPLAPRPPQYLAHLCGPSERYAGSWTDECVLTLTRLRDVAVPGLTRSLASRDPAVRRWAAFTLGELRGHALPALPALLERLGDVDDDVRVEAARALGKTVWNDQDKWRWLEGQLTASFRPSKARALVEALCYLTHDFIHWGMAGEAEAEAEERRRDERVFVDLAASWRALVREKLGLLGDLASSPATHPQPRRMAVAGMTQIIGELVTIFPYAEAIKTPAIPWQGIVAAYTDAAGATHPRVREAALLGLAQAADFVAVDPERDIPSGLREHFQNALADPDREVRRRAALMRLQFAENRAERSTAEPRNK